MKPTDYVGSFVVYPIATARTQAWELCDDKAKELWKLRKHAFNLAYFPDGGVSGADLDWDWITGFERLRIGELRIDEKINGRENIRIIFFKANLKLGHEPFPRIWLLSVFPKKRQDFGKGQLAAFRGMRTIIVERYYDGSPQA